MGTSGSLLLLAMPLLVNRGGCSSFCLHPHYESSFVGDCPRGCCKSLRVEDSPLLMPRYNSLVCWYLHPIYKAIQVRLSSLFITLSLVSSTFLSLMIGFLPLKSSRAESWDAARALLDLLFHVLSFVSLPFGTEMCQADYFCVVLVSLCHTVHWLCPLAL